MSATISVGPTPAPWAFAAAPEGGYDVWHYDKGEREPFIAAVQDYPNAEADARLITAAPDLLASAREAYKYSAFHQSDCRGVASYAEGEIFDPTIGCDCYLARLKAAIAKAEGEQS